MSRVIVGLTGGIGSGKSEVAQQLANYGIAIIDADEISRHLVQNDIPISKKIIEHFGETVLDTKNTLDRNKLRAIVFNRPEERIWLEKLLHPKIVFRMLQQAKQAQSPYCVLVLPLLIEAKLNHLVDYILVIDTTKKLQIERTKKSRLYSDKEILAILKAQVSRKKRIAVADYVIKNNSTLSNLKKQVAKWHKAYLKELAIQRLSLEKLQND